MSAVRVEIGAGVMTVTLADVENRNALGAALVQGLHDAIVAASKAAMPVCDSTLSITIT